MGSGFHSLKIGKSFWVAKPEALFQNRFPSEPSIVIWGLVYMVSSYLPKMAAAQGNPLWNPSTSPGEHEGFKYMKVCELNVKSTK